MKSGGEGSLINVIFTGLLKIPYMGLETWKSVSMIVNWFDRFV